MIYALRERNGVLQRLKFSSWKEALELQEREAAETSETQSKEVTIVMRDGTRKAADRSEFE